MDIKIGDKEIDFVFQGDELIYPNYIKDGLVLHYDFSGMGNNDVTRGVARDLSGNENDGILNNFAFDAGSGYADNGLEFDGVDDVVRSEEVAIFTEDFTMEACFNVGSDSGANIKGILSWFNHIQFRGVSLYLRYTNILYFETGLVNDTRPFVSTGILLEEGVTTLISLSYTKSDRSIVVHKDGIEVYSTTLEYDIKVGSNEVNVGRWAYSHNNYFLKSNTYSSRIYNRALTPEEIAHNYKIDKHRFNIQD